MATGLEALHTREGRSFVVGYVEHRVQPYHVDHLQHWFRRRKKCATAACFFRLREGAHQRTAWQATLKRAGVPHFPIYNLRHAFCTRLSWVAPDGIIERAMRHTSPETKRHYQLGMVEQIREAMEKANQQVYGGSGFVH